MTKRLPFLVLLAFCCNNLFGQDSACIKVHFLYGSKPLKKYRATERKWFGGLMGGHVGIEGDSNMVLNFHHKDGFHVFNNKNNRHSKFALNSGNQFWEIFGGKTDSVKKATVIIPVTKQQKQKFDSISKIYIKQTPYDYAFIGMRCGAASYEILGQLGVLKRYPNQKTYMKIFYPKKLRQQLFSKARKNGWAIIIQKGSTRRKWETD